MVQFILVCFLYIAGCVKYTYTAGNKMKLNAKDIITNDVPLCAFMSWHASLLLVEDCDSLTNKPHIQFVYLRRHLCMYTCCVLET